MSGFPAWRMGIWDRGVVRPGAYADLVVLDPDKVTDKATLDDPEVPSLGIDWVLVNGVVELADRKVTHELGGVVLRKRGA
jgi:N-acyl-D-amino-acid deacylase